MNALKVVRVSKNKFNKKMIQLKNKKIKNSKSFCRRESKSNKNKDRNNLKNSRNKIKNYKRKKKEFYLPVDSEITIFVRFLIFRLISKNIHT